MRIVRPDKMSFAVKAFVTKHLGVEFTHVPEFDMNQCFADSSSVKPIILVLFPGCDPLSPVLNFMPETEGKVIELTRLKIQTKKFSRWESGKKSF